jgi:hypothetical protein
MDAANLVFILSKHVSMSADKNRREMDMRLQNLK